MAETTSRAHEGITPRHRAGCRTLAGGRCNCTPAYRAEAFDRRSGKRLYKTFPTLAAARAWRADAMRDIRRGVLRGPTGVTLRESAEEWLDGVKAGAIRTRGGSVYKPSALRGYEAALTARILPALGGRKLEDITRADVQALVDRLMREGLDASTIRNALMPLRVIYRRLVARGVVAVNPTSALELPALEGKRDRIASPGEAARRLQVLPMQDRALWATAIYAGLRLGELQALEWASVDLAGGMIHVVRSWDPKSGVYVDPKSRAGTRRVPVSAVLRDHLMEHKLATGGEGLVWRGSGVTPLASSTISDRSRRAWRAAGMTAITLHECRHTYASLMIAAGVNAKALSTYMGHANIAVTFDRYGHLMPGNENEAAALLDAYLERADTKARLAALEE